MQKIKIYKFPHSCFLIEIKGRRILIDPGIYCTEKNFGAENFKKIDIMLITHAHIDHCDKNLIKEIRKNNKNMSIISNTEVKEALEADEIKSMLLSYGKREKIHGIEILSIKSEHGKPLAGEKPEHSSFLIDNKIYHAGDSVYSREIASFLKSLKNKKILILPISGYVAMDYKQACKFAKEANASMVIPMHYDSPRFNVDPDDFIREAEKLGLNAEVIESGKFIEVMQ